MCNYSQQRIGGRNGEHLSGIDHGTTRRPTTICCYRGGRGQPGSDLECGWGERLRDHIIHRPVHSPGFPPEPGIRDGAGDERGGLYQVRDGGGDLDGGAS